MRERSHCGGPSMARPWRTSWQTAKNSALLKRRQYVRPALEPLEDRTLPAVAIWTGAGADATWMTAGNWQHGAPSPGDQLIFPATGVVPASFTNVNNFPAGTMFQSITFLGAG